MEEEKSILVSDKDSNEDSYEGLRILVRKG